MAIDTPKTVDAVRLVLGVARLGENDLHGWWKGHAMDRTGRYVLSSIFRRTWRAAALELDVTAAAAMHDELLGRRTAVHLFSDLLPFRRWAMGWLAEQKTSPQPNTLLTQLEGWIAEDSTNSLRSWCGSVKPVKGEPLGHGLLLGRLSTSQIADPATQQQTAKQLAAAYIDQIGPLRPPYFDLSR